MTVTTWIGLGLFVVLAAAGAWLWGALSDPKKGGTVGCCHCGQCLVSGECVYRRKLLEKSAAGKQK